MVNVGI